jgi:hypothetical protein
MHRIAALVLSQTAKLLPPGCHAEEIIFERDRRKY